MADEDTLLHMESIMGFDVEENVEAGKSCFIFKPKKSRSWLQSDQECRRLGGLMVNLETAQKWTEVTTLLQYSHERFVWVGLRATRHNKDKAAVEAMYTNTWQWLSGSVAYYLSLNPIREDRACVKLVKTGSTASDFHEMIAWECYTAYPAALLCKLPLSSEAHDVSQPVTLAVSPATSLSRTPLVTCPLHHVVHEMLACDLESRCGKLNNPGEWYKAACNMAEESPQPYFYCGVQGQYVPYSLVCDHREDCASGEDEYFCVYPPCKGYVLNCGRGQCVDVDKRCDGRRDCLTNADEENCRATLLTYSPVEPPAVVTFDRPGGFTLTALAEPVTHCPETHFLCSAGGYCLPVYVRCNGIIDCPGHEDEVRCSHAVCPGFYRCRGKDRTVCVHVHHLCDGWPQCPQQDDEATCSMTCPRQCTCQGLAFTCTITFSLPSFPQLRYLEARGSGLLQNDTAQNTMLIHLGVQACGWSTLTDFTLFNLHSLDLSDNLLRHINFSHFMGMQQLRRLSLARNPISVGFSGDQRKYRQPSLMVFNISGVRLHSLNLSILSAVLSDLKVLILTHGGELSLQGQSVFPSLRVLDLTGTLVSQFPPNFMKSMVSLQRVFADSFKLCCQTVLPDIFPGECSAPVDEISSCDDLLKSNVHRLALGVFCVLSILGNGSSFAYRLLSSPRKIQNGFSLFVVHLCVSDFLMGLYLAFIGLADRVYAGTYVWSETIWKRSTVCRVAGLLSLLSSEVSAFIICLITIDRFIVLHFPFSQFRFRGASAHLACAIIWLLGIFLASVPLLPALSYWKFYHQTGICIPLPVSRADFPGHGYSFGVMIVCNFILFLLIALGQSMIYWSVRANAMSDPKAKNTAMDSVQSTETVLARRLLSIAVSDFLCWFPVGLCGLLAGAGILISEKVSVALAIFVLPLNSALNPFIYTLNVMLEKRQKARELRLRKFVHAHLSQHLKGTMTMN